jgi:membrane associated rhomboid family serine protease
MRCYRHPDRETGLSCSDCGRPICVDCMTVAPVGIRCPDHAGAARQSSGPSVGPVRMPRRKVAQPVRFKQGDPIVTKVLVGLNIAVYLLELALGGSTNGTGNWIYEHGALMRDICCYSDGTPAGLEHGEWWRLITAAFLHYGPIHLALNMLALWWLGAPVELALGRWRFLLLYVVSGLAGSAGALLFSPNDITVGASGAIFGLLGAGLILEYEATGRLAGNYMTLIVINLVFTFAFPGISIGGHLGGLIGGILGALVLTGFGQRRVSFGDISAGRTFALVAIGILSIAIAYWRVRGLA